jgi:hypothetical protein
MYAKNAEIEGKIIAKSGTIGNWNISANWIDSYTGTRENDGYTSRFFLDSNAGSTDYYLYAAADIGDGAGYTRKFSVSKYGVLYAKGA